jgi:hypothetical protein
MNFEDHLPDAIATVSAWDLPEEDFARAVNDQARLMAGDYPDDIWTHEAAENPYTLRHHIS